MGNSASTSRAQQEDSVDYGYLTPQGIYSGTPDWNQQIVAQLIVERRLAPFYRPLEDYDENWDDEQILAARKQPPGEDVATSDPNGRGDGIGSLHGSVTRTNSVHSSLHTARRPGALKEPSRLPEALVYRGAVECPICFLYYPPNINHSRCCDQAICTECFVQIKRTEPTTTHVVSEPAACPYCVQENFGVTYNPPPWRAGIGAEGSSPISLIPSRGSSQQPSVETNKNRRKSFGADSAEVVTIDQIRPDWEAKLAAVRAAVARRANRRIIMRQVGDRLIPVGVTSGRIHPLSSGEGIIVANGESGSDNFNEIEGRSRRSRRRQHQQQPQDVNQMFGTMGLAGQDLEELMVMEAMRLSLLEQEERQKKEAEEKRKKESERLAKGGEPSSNANREGEAGPSSSVPGSQLPPIRTSSPIDLVQSSARGLRPVNSLSSERVSVSFSPRSSPASRSDAESRSVPSKRESPALGALATNSLRVSTAHSGSSGDSRPGSVTPSIRAPTPQGTAGSPPSSTLSVALAAHGTASAMLAAGNSENTGNDPTNVPGSSTSAAVDSLDSQDARAAPTAAQGGDMSASIADARETRPGQDRSFSSLFTGNGDAQPYDALPSSPDSPSQQPLLLETPVSEMPGHNLESARVSASGTDVQTEVAQ